MTGHVTTSRNDSIIDLPISMAQLELKKEDSIVITSVKLSLGQVLRINWLSMQLISMKSGSPTKITDSLGFVYGGVFAAGFDTVRRPSGTPIFTRSINSPLTKVLNPHIIREFSGPDIIEFVAVNNTSNVDVEIAMMGDVKLYTSG